MSVLRVSKLMILTALVAALPAPAMAQSRDINTYVLFALKEIRTKGQQIRSGHVGVNQVGGLLSVSPHGQLLAPQSNVVADLMRSPPGSLCKQLFSGMVYTAMPSCGPATSFEFPIVQDPMKACGFPDPFPSCSSDSGKSEVVLADSTMTLPPDPAGYHDVQVLGGGTLILSGGDYRFCNLRAGRNANIIVERPATIHVAQTMNLGNSVFLGPPRGTQPSISPRDVRVFVNGALVHFSVHADVHAVLCAPAATLRLTREANLNGVFVASRIRTERITGELPSTTTTTTSSTTSSSTSSTIATTTTTTKSTTSTSRPSTTTTTVPGDCTKLCGNGRIDPACREDCDKNDFGNTKCPGGSVAGAFLSCNADCTIDFDACPNGPACGNGVKEPFEQCDPVALNPGCPTGKVCGAAGTAVGCLCVPKEICGNCIDDDGNGHTDFEDAACCPQAQTFRMTVSNARLRPRGTVSALRLRTVLARAGLSKVNPQKQDVFVQIRPQGGPDLFCARIPADKFMKIRRGFSFWDKKHKVTSARGISDAKIMIRADGTVRFRALGRRAQMQTPPRGPLQLTVGLHDATGGDANNSCSTATPAFRTGRRGRLIAP